MVFRRLNKFDDPAPNPKTKANRARKLDFDDFDWPKYISEETLVDAIPTVYGCDPRDEEKYRILLEETKAARETANESNNAPTDTTV
jgi:hypothetical protein